jgi:hypothetical protein
MLIGLATRLFGEQSATEDEVFDEVSQGYIVRSDVKRRNPIAFKLDTIFYTLTKMVHLRNRVSKCTSIF